VDVFAGIEAVRIPEFGIDVASEDLERSLRAVCPPARGIVASWNLLQISEVNLEILGTWKR